MERRVATEQQLKKDHELLKERLPDLLFKVLKNPELEDELEHDLVFRPDMKTARCRRDADEIHFGTDNSKMENLRVARKTLVHEAIHAVGVNHNGRMRSLDFYSQLSRDLFTDKIMEKLCWEPTDEEETRRRSKRKGKRNYKYVAYCPECGNEWYRKKRSKLIKHSERYQCEECGSRLKSRDLDRRE